MTGVETADRWRDSLDRAVHANPANAAITPLFAERAEHRIPSTPRDAPEEGTATLSSTWVGLLLLLGVLVTAWTVEVTADRASFFGVEGPGCLLKTIAGEHACPGCGLTRSVALAAQGRWAASARLHPAGPWILALVVSGVLVHSHALWRRKRSSAHQLLLSTGRWLFCIVLFTGYLGRLFFGS